MPNMDRRSIALRRNSHRRCSNHKLGSCNRTARAASCITLIVGVACCRRESVPDSKDLRPGPVPGHRAVASGACPAFANGRKMGDIESKGLDEASGLAASRLNPGVLWSHNDSGGSARLWAMTFDGDDLGTYSLEGVSATDWEDVALGPGANPGQWYLYVGDIGANGRRRMSVVVHRVVEPKVELDQKDKKRQVDDFTTWNLRYPGGPAPDAEALMVDPETADLYVVAKVDSPHPHVYRARTPHDSDPVIDLVDVATLTLPTDSGHSYLVTAGDISADGRWVLVRTYSDAYVWPRPPGLSLAEATKDAPCRVPLDKEAQGEAIARSPSGFGYFTVSEGTRESIDYFGRL
jgi:hypothetical protein